MQQIQHFLLKNKILPTYLPRLFRLRGTIFALPGV